MSKFLKIIENNIPSKTNESKLAMVSMLVKLIDTIQGIDVSVVDHNTFIININGSDITVDVRDIETNVSEQSSFDHTYDIDQEVNKMASKALYKGPGSGLFGKFGTTPMKAQAAVKKRENVIKTAISVYNDITKDLEQAVGASKLRTKTGSGYRNPTGVQQTNINVI